METPDHPLLKALEPVIEGIAATFGRDCEVVLHDLRVPQRSLRKIVNNQTGRQIGAPIRDLVLRVLRSRRFRDDILANYMIKTEDGKLFKSTTILVRDADDEPLAALCINLNLERVLLGRRWLDEFAATVDLKESEDEEVEIEDEDVWKLLNRIVDRVVEAEGVPVSSMTKDDKVRIVGFLYEKGTFLVKGSVDQVAYVLGVSRYTVYNYIEEARAKLRDESSGKPKTTGSGGESKHVVGREELAGD